MTTLHAGALLQRPPGPKYLEQLHFAELAFESSLPKPVTLARWRSTVAEEFQVALVMPKAGRPGAADPDSVMPWVREAYTALAARFLVVPTGPELSPSTRHREHIRTYFHELAELRPVWAPGGLWDMDTALPFAAKHGIHCAFDPLADDTAPATEPGYCRLRAIGARRRFSEGLLYDLLSTLEESGFGEAYVALESPRSFREAAALQELQLENAGM